MLVVETIARIRREHFIKGKTIKEIARDLKVSRNTVRKVLRSGETSFEYERVVQPRPKLGRWAAELDGLLAGMQPRLLASSLRYRIFEELRGDRCRAPLRPDDGARSADNRRLRPTPLSFALEKPTSSTGAAQKGDMVELRATTLRFAVGLSVFSPHGAYMFFRVLENAFA